MKLNNEVKVISAEAVVDVAKATGSYSLTWAIYKFCDSNVTNLFDKY